MEEAGLELERSDKATSGYLGVSCEGGRFFACLHGKRLGGISCADAGVASKQHEQQPWWCEM